MKTILFPLCPILLLALSAHTVMGQHSETAIRKMEDLEREAVLKGDTVSLFNRYWSPQMVVNTPANRVGTVAGTKANVRAGRLDYHAFERNIEQITFHENIAIVMGQEMVKPRGVADNAGKTVTRRYTNIWAATPAGWQLIARQATIIKVE